MLQIDPVYLELLIPALLLTVAAQAWVIRSYRRYGGVPNRAGVTGAEAASKVLKQKGLFDVRLDKCRGFLKDHFDPQRRLLRLSRDVHAEASITALGVAAQQVAHALQDDEGLPGLRAYSAAAPLARVASNLAIPVGVLAFFVPRFEGLVLTAAVVVFVGAVLLHVIAFPLELMGTRRALAVIDEARLLAPDEVPGVKKVLLAASLRPLGSVLAITFLPAYFLARMGLLGGRERS